MVNYTVGRRIGRSRQPHSTILLVPHESGIIPIVVDTASINRPYGPVSNSTRMMFTASTILFNRRGSNPDIIDAILFPDHIVSQYPVNADTAVANITSRNVLLAMPEIIPPDNSLNTIAVPDLPLPDTDNATTDRTEVTVPIDATLDMKSSGDLSLKIQDDMLAPTVDVIPGNHPAMHPIRTPLSPDIILAGSSHGGRWVG